MTEPITTELRGVMSHTTMAGIPLVELGEYEFASRCDAIDAVHANLERENESLRRELDRTRGEWDYWESTHVELPKDADGVPWHIGDVTENGQTVSAMGLNKHGWHFVGTVNDIDPAIHRHHHPDTWERIIEDAIDAVDDVWADERHDALVASLVARCKALAGDAE